MPNPQNDNQQKQKKWAIMGLAALGLLVVFNMASGESTPKNSAELSYGEFVDKVKNGDIKGDVTMQYTDSKSMKVIAGKPQQEGFFTSMREGETKAAPPYFTVTSQPEEKIRADLRAASNDVKPAYIAPEQSNPYMSGLMTFGPILLLVGVIIWSVRRQMGAGAGGASAFGKSKAKMTGDNESKVTFADVAGADEAKEELQDLVDFLKNPKKYQKLGAEAPRGVLLDGPPGCGKTLLAKAVAGEAKVPFFSIAGSQFVEMFVGVGAARARDLFENAKKHAPCIVFIDEIDAIGGTRGTGAQKHEEREGTLNQLLVEMDGFEGNSGVIVLGATNRPETLDPALTRAGRFDTKVTVNRPDKKGREEILKVHTRGKPLAADVKLKTIASGTPGFSGADLADLAKKAANEAVKRNGNSITMRDFEQAKDKILMGAERKSMIMSEEERRMTAYHEAGHALVGLKVPGNDPLHMVSIIPRGRALGVTVNLPEDDRFSIKKFELNGKMAMAYGGRIAEEMIFGPEGVSGGASGDIIQATKMARVMITQWGMSDKLGRVNYGADPQEMSFHRAFSESTQQVIDEEVKNLTNAAEAMAREILAKHRKELDLIAAALLEHEKLTGDQIRGLLEGKEIVRVDDDATLDTIAPSDATAVVPPAAKPVRPSEESPTMH